MISRQTNPFVGENRHPLFGIMPMAVWGVTMRIMMAALGLAVALGGLPMAETAQAQTATQVAQARPNSDVSAQTRQRPRVRIYRTPDERGVYPSYNPGPNAVRDCTANLVQEYRPSGTVIVPRMNCYWRRG
jgi:hypothetical protein